MIFWLTVAAVLATALMGGVFFVFSSVVMPALGRIPPAEGIRAMQRINIDVFHWSFCLAFFGAPILAAGLGGYALVNWHESRAVYCVVGASIYLLGSLLVTGVGNVPLNNALAKIDADKVDAAREWENFVVGWVRWNHVRTVACLVAAGAFVAALF